MNNNTAVPSERGTILFVDDDQAILNSLRRLMRKQGYHCLFAGSGQEGLDILEEETPDLVVSDMRMPEMSGDRFLAEVKRRRPESVRYLLTGQAEIEATINAVNQGGISRFIHKPWDDNDFLAVIQDGIRIARLESENRQLLKTTTEQAAELKSLNQDLERRIQDRTAMLRKAMRQLESSYDSFVRTFSYFISSRSGLIKGQSQAVADLVSQMCDRLGVEESEKKHMVYGALLHELGKLVIGEDVLSRSEIRLTSRDMEEYRKYPVVGEMALADIRVLEKASRIIRHHNELYDGSGYPDRIAGEDIPLGARMICLCRDFLGIQTEFMRTVPLDADAALLYVRQQAGKRYDPELVDVLAQCDLQGTRHATPQERIVAIPDLEPGMKLCRDLVTDRGVLLMSKNRILTEGVINRLRRMHTNDGFDLPVHITQPARELQHE